MNYKNKMANHTQSDAHCWKYYLKKYNFDYILQNRQRVNWNLEKQNNAD